LQQDISETAIACAELREIESGVTVYLKGSED